MPLTAPLPSPPLVFDFDQDLPEPAVMYDIMMSGLSRSAPPDNTFDEFLDGFPSTYNPDGRRVISAPNPSQETYNDLYVPMEPIRNPFGIYDSTGNLLFAPTPNILGNISNRPAPIRTDQLYTRYNEFGELIPELVNAPYRNLISPPLTANYYRPVFSSSSDGSSPNSSRRSSANEDPEERMVKETREAICNNEWERQNNNMRKLVEIAQGQVVEANAEVTRLAKYVKEKEDKANKAIEKANKEIEKLKLALKEEKEARKKEALKRQEVNQAKINDLVEFAVLDKLEGFGYPNGQMKY